MNPVPPPQGVRRGYYPPQPSCYVPQAKTPEMLQRETELITQYNELSAEAQRLFEEWAKVRMKMTHIKNSNLGIVFTISGKYIKKEGV